MRVSVPSPDAPWIELWEFALTYSGYERHGGFEAAAGVANGARARWETRSVMPSSLDEARCALFFEQRRWRHFGSTPTGHDERYITLLVNEIRELSGGTVTVDSDPM